jgi:outer membrane receptor protein involved in Fe transport
MASNYLAKGLKRSTLTVALGLCFAGAVQAQSTTGNITGTVPAGSTVTISNNSGLTRTVTADANGRYTANQLPVGQYTVKSGADTRTIVVTVGSSANVSFGGDATNLGVVTVVGSNVPSIDVTATDTRTVITAEELKRLPMPRSAESIALLSPGAVSGNGTYFGNQISFGGSSVAENAYYLNGYFSGNPMTNVGGFTLPYGSIEQQETYTGGYGAKYGRSSGGVISQIGKSGSNDWTFGGQVVYTPKSLKETRPDRDYPSDLAQGYDWANDALPGTAYDKGEDRLSWETVYSAYVGGPLLKDKLFFFVSAENTKGNRNSPGTINSVTSSKYSSDDPKIYAKLNWNINDNNLLEATYVSEKYDETGKTYGWDWDSYSNGDYLQPATGTSSNTEFSILKYTGYLTDNLTLSATYGRSRNRYNESPYLTGLPAIAGSTSQNPAINGGTAIRNPQATYRAASNTSDYTDGLRVELEWLLGNHTFTLGMDNTKLEGVNEGTSQVAGYWGYAKSASDKTNISSSLGVGPTGEVPGACNGAPKHDGTGTSNPTGPHGNIPEGASSNCGYQVRQLKYFDTTSMHNKQAAYYLEDKWQVTDNLLLSLGVRADTYQNFSDTGTKFVDSGTQWQPRLGFAWDVNGDSSFKVFGNAGRYFLNMPNAVAIRGVGASTYTSEYFTYTGIDANGIPTGLTPVGRPGSPGTPAGPVSSNGEIGTPKDPLTYVPSDIKSQYQDEYVLGFEHALSENWTLGAKFTKRELKSAIDDVCDPYTMMTAAGLDPVVQYANGSAKNGPLSQYIGADSSGKQYAIAGCYMFNPGGSNTYAFQEITGTPVVDGGSGIYTNVDGSYMKQKIASSDLGMPALKRSYEGLDFFLERKWDGKWGARFDYTYSKSRGNSEGPANSDTGQGGTNHDNGVATSQNWDAWQIMAYATGYLPNDRRHQFKAHGSYAITPEWMVSANVRIQSGAPIMCFGFYDPDGSIPHDSGAADPIGYGPSYHTCFGEAWTPGKKTAPWTHRYDLGLTYKPAAFDHKLAIGVNVFNAFNEVKPTSYDQTSEDDPYVQSNTFGMPVGFTTPRYVQFSVSYDY